MKRIIGMVALIVPILALAAMASWTAEDAAKFEAWTKVPAAERYKRPNGPELGRLLHCGLGKPSVAQVDSALAIIKADSEAGVASVGKGNGAAGYLSKAQMWRACAMGVEAKKMLTKDVQSLKAAEAAFADSAAYAVKVKQVRAIDITSISFYYMAWKLGHYTHAQRVSQYNDLCAMKGVNKLRTLFQPHLLPQYLNDPAAVRAGACIAAVTHGRRADDLLDQGIIKMVVEANAVGEIDNVEAARILGAVVKASWARCQLDYPADGDCTTAQLAKKTALKAAANKVASVLDGIVSTM